MTETLYLTSLHKHLLQLHHTAIAPTHPPYSYYTAPCSHMFHVLICSMFSYVPCSHMFHVLICSICNDFCSLIVFTSPCHHHCLPNCVAVHRQTWSQPLSQCTGVFLMFSYHIVIFHYHKLLFFLFLFCVHAYAHLSMNTCGHVKQV